MEYFPLCIVRDVKHELLNEIVTHVFDSRNPRTLNYEELKTYHKGIKLRCHYVGSADEFHMIFGDQMMTTEYEMNYPDSSSETISIIGRNVVGKRYKFVMKMPRMYDEMAYYLDGKFIVDVEKFKKHIVLAISELYENYMKQKKESL